MFSDQDLSKISESLNDIAFIKNEFKKSSVFLVLEDDSEFESMIEALMSSEVSVNVIKPRLRSDVMYSSILNLENFNEHKIRTTIQRYNEDLKVSFWKINEVAEVTQNKFKVNFTVDLASSIEIENNDRKIKCEMGTIDMELYKRKSTNYF